MKDWYREPVMRIDDRMRKQAEQRQLSLTKPAGSLGKLESLATALCAMQKTPEPRMENIQIAVFAGDHGVADEGVSVFPQIVTGEMVKNFISGKAAISVMADHIGAGLTVIDAGTKTTGEFPHPVVNRPISAGTANILDEPAMTLNQCRQALALGADIAAGFESGTQLVIGGDMGIGNTTSAAALGVAYGIGTAQTLTGPGTGLDRHGVNKKIGIVQRAAERITGINDPLRILSELGGFEIAALAGYFIHSAQRGFTLLIDGFISTAAALAACRINPQCRQWMLFAHTSAEPGHKSMLERLAAEPILSLNMRLGEGSGSAVAVPILRCACELHNNMATFAEAGVTTA